ncbi:MAG: hypothetical protein GY765_30320 [bacterium]|nr:hypothetical protein [bacterium]
MKIDQTDAISKLFDTTGINKNQKTPKSGAESFGNLIDGDSYEQPSIDASAIYKNPKLALDSATVQQFLDQNEEIHESVTQIVTDMFHRQGITDEQIKEGEIKNFTVDEMARAEAEKLIGPGGDLSPEKVSDRIVDFSIAAFGGNKEKYDIIKTAIDRGFAEAKHMLGGELPEISNKTYDLIQDKLQQWLDGDSKETGENTVQATDENQTDE